MTVTVFLTNSYSLPNVQYCIALNYVKTGLTHVQPNLTILLLDRLFVSIEPVEESKRDVLPINALDGLTMHYKVKSLRIIQCLNVT